MKHIKPFLPVLIVCAAFFTTSCSDDFADSPYPPLELHSIAPFPPGGRASAIAFVNNGKAYVAMGRNLSRGGYQKDCWQFNPDNNEWKKMADFPGEARGKAIAQTVDSISYAGLGYGGSDVYTSNGYLNDFWAYNPRTNSWTRKADYPSTTVNAAVTFVYNKEIYVCEGGDGFNFRGEVWKYNPASDKWIQLNDNKAHNRGGCVMTCNSLNRCFFGLGYNGENQSDWWEYFPSSDSWQQKSSVPDGGRVNAVSLACGEHIFIATGRYFAGTETGGRPKKNIIEYDTNKDQWYKRGEIPGSGRENAIGFVINGHAYIGLGENDSELLNDVWTFIP